MKKIIDDMYSLLLEQKAVQEKLLDLTIKKREAVVKNDTDRLTSIVDLEYTVLSEMNAVEKRRLKLAEGFLEKTGKKARDITVSDLIDLADEQQGKQLREVQKELLDIIQRLKAQNDENRSLTHMQLEYTDTLLSVIAGSNDPLNNFYDGDGQSVDAQISRGINILDAEI